MKLLLLLLLNLLLLAGCAKPPGAPVLAELPAPATGAACDLPTAPPIPPASGSAVPMTPHDILLAADQARADAYG